MRSIKKIKIIAGSSIILLGILIGSIYYFSENRLIIVCRENNLEKVKNLIVNGSNINVKDSEGFTPLMIASRIGNFEIVKFLVKNGADLNSLQGKTSLYFALENSEEMAMFLIKNGVNLNDDKQMAQLLFIKAACYKYYSILEYFLKNNLADVNGIDKRKLCALTSVISKDDKNISKFLIQKGADVNIIDGYGNAPLMKAAQCNLASIDLLLSSGAKINLQNKEGETALMRAADWHKPQNIELLLKNGAFVNLKDKDGKTALDKTHGRSENIKILLKYGAKTGKELEQEKESK